MHIQIIASRSQPTAKTKQWDRWSAWSRFGDGVDRYHQKHSRWDCTCHGLPAFLCPSFLPSNPIIDAPLPAPIQDKNSMILKRIGRRLGEPPSFLPPFLRSKPTISAQAWVLMSVPSTLFCFGYQVLVDILIGYCFWSDVCSSDCLVVNPAMMIRNWRVGWTDSIIVFARQANTTWLICNASDPWFQ